jgi:hypothetical protein
VTEEDHRPVTTIAKTDAPAILSPSGVPDRYHVETVVTYPSNDKSGPIRKKFKGTLEADKPNCFEAAEGLVSYVMGEFHKWVDQAVTPVNGPDSECVVEISVEFGRVAEEPVAEEKFSVKVGYSGPTNRALQFAFGSVTKDVRKWFRDLLGSQPNKSPRG